MRERIATAILSGVARRLWGFAPNLMPQIVAQRGAMSALAWFVGNMPRYERTLRLWGPLRTHLVCTQISLLNGCPYCVYGHAYALELHYLRETGALFPLDENELMALQQLDEEQSIERFDAALRASQLAGEATVVARLRELRRDRGRAESETDRRLIHLLDMFSVLNTCGIRGRVPIDEAHDPINRDRALKARYAAARATGSARAAAAR